MRKVMLIMAVLAAPFAVLFGETTVTLNEFSGGSASLRLIFNTDSMYGSRGDGLRAGGTVSSLDFHPSVSSYNPAAFAFMKKPYISVNVVPSALLSSPVIEAFSGTSFSDSAAEGINSVFEDMFEDNEDIVVAPGVKTQVDSASAYAAQGMGIMGFEAAYPFAQNQAAVGASREEKFSLEMSMLLNGIQALINMEDSEDPAFDMSMRMRADASLDLQINNVVTSFVLGRKLSPQWGIGVSIDHYESRIKAYGGANINAIATLSGDTLEYNTDETNSLRQTLYSELTASNWGLRFGTTFQLPAEKASFELDFNVMPRLEYSGPMEAVYHKLPDNDTIMENFLYGYTETIKETLSDADKPRIEMRLPSSMRATLSWKPGAVITFNYTRYFSPFSFIVDTKDKRYEVFLEMMDAFRLGFNFQWFQIGGGIILAREGMITEDKELNEVKTEDAWYPVPVFSTGFIIPIGDYVRTEWVLLAVPAPVLKAAVTFVF